MIRTRAAATAVGLLLLSGCGSFADKTADPTAAPSSTSSSAAGSPMHEHEVEATPIPTVTPAGGRTPQDLTIAVMSAYIDHDVSAEAWYENLAGYLSQAGQEAYYGTDPALVPATSLIGQPSVVAESPYLVTTAMATDVGEYRLLFARAADGTWQVERIVPPEAPQPTA